MARFKNSQQVAALLKAAAGKDVSERHYDTEAEGVSLVFKGSQRSWFYKFTSPELHRRRDMGLGAATGDAAVTLAVARARAAEARVLVSKGVDPIGHRKAGRPNVGCPTFKEAAEAMVKARAPGWKGGDKSTSADAWRSTLSLNTRKDGKPTGYCQSLLERRVDAITSDHILAVLQPLWVKHNPIAQQLRQRIEMVLDAQRASGNRSGDNPADLKLLASRLPMHKHRVRHHAAVPHPELPGVMAALAPRKGLGYVAVRLAILTALRESECCEGRWSEIDMTERLWRIPAVRMKVSENGDHVVPLSDAAMEILREMSKLRPDDNDGPIFPGWRDRTASIVGDLLRVSLQRVAPGMTPHGTARASFKTWQQDVHPALGDAAELCLHHPIGDATRRAYSRSALLPQRRQLLEAWGDHLAGQTAPAANDVQRLGSELAAALAASNPSAAAELERVLAAVLAGSRADTGPTLRLAA